MNINIPITQWYNAAPVPKVLDMNVNILPNQCCTVAPILKVFDINLNIPPNPRLSPNICTEGI